MVILRCCLRTVLLMALIMGFSGFPYGVVLADLNDGLVAYYPFNGNANDESGNGNHGISKGGLVYVNGVFGQAGKFDGTNTYVDIGDKVDAMGDSITVSAWVKTSNYNQHAKIVNKGRTSAGTPRNSGYSLRFVPPDYTQSGEYELRFDFVDDNDVSAYASLPVSKLPIDQFFLVTGVLNRQGSNSILELYVNGKLVSNETAKFTSSNTNIPLAIGALHRASFGITSEIFDGLIDEVRIYNRALSESEIQQLYQGCQPSIDIVLNSNNRVTGDKVVVNAHIKGPSSPDSSCESINVVETIWAQLPDGFVISLIQPFTALTLLPGDDTETKIFEYTFNGNEPLGSYEIGGSFLHPLSGKNISTDIEILTFSQ